MTLNPRESHADQEARVQAGAAGGQEVGVQTRPLVSHVDQEALVQAGAAGG